MQPDSRGFLEGLIDDGRPLITLTGLCLGLSGVFAIFQSATGQFLPHDTAFLQMQPEELCSINECRIVHFMFHDRVSFGGSLIAIAVVTCGWRRSRSKPVSPGPGGRSWSAASQGSGVFLPISATAIWTAGMRSRPWPYFHASSAGSGLRADAFSQRQRASAPTLPGGPCCTAAAKHHGGHVRVLAVPACFLPQPA